MIALQCIDVAWYLACDMQFYFLAPAVVFPIWHSETIGLIWWLALLTLFTAIPSFMTAHYHFPPNLTTR